MAAIAVLAAALVVPGARWAAAGMRTAQPVTAMPMEVDSATSDRGAHAGGEYGLRRAALRISISTTSDWVRVDLPGVSAGHVAVTNPQRRDIRPTDRGVLVRGPLHSHGLVEVDVVTEIDWSLEQGFVTVTQGGAGRTTTSVTNVTAAPRATTSVHTDWAMTTRSVPVTADLLMGAEQLEWVRADDERRVLAFTYPWYGDWATTDPRLSVHPTDPWNNQHADEARRITELARANGVDGFVMSFSGGASHGLPLDNLLEAAAETDGTATVLIETAQAGSAEVAEQWIVEALRQADSPAFQRLDGVPVVFAFGSGTVSAAEWQAMTDRLAAAGTPVQIVADTWAGEGGPMSGLYRYNALLQTPTDEMTAEELTAWNQSISRRLRARATLGAGDPGLVVSTVQPGWERLNRVEGEPVIDRAGTATYDRTWRAALAGEADWVLITSWNEWFEGTGIAPSVEHGDTALRATAAWAERFRR